MDDIEKNQLVRCKNPCCSNQFKLRRGKEFCTNSCRWAYHNEKKRQDQETTFQAEKKLRHNVSVLKKCLQHPLYQKSGTIDRLFLEWEGYHFGVFTAFKSLPTKDGGPDRTIFWSHDYGIECIEQRKEKNFTSQFFTIHTKQ